MFHRNAATAAPLPGSAMEPPMLDLITPVLALVPYIVILAALASIPTDALLNQLD
jgi:hypothetical protein